MKRIRKEGTDSNPRFKMMEKGDGITLREIEKWYGKDTASALVQYCDKMKKDIDDVAGNDREWDRFEMWSKSKKRGLGTHSSKFSDWQKAAKMDDDNKRKKKAGKEFEEPDVYLEGSGSRMEENDILDWIFQEMGDCEWADDMEYVDNENAFEVAMPGPDGDVFKVSVTKVWSGRLGERLD